MKTAGRRTEILLTVILLGLAAAAAALDARSDIATALRAGTPILARLHVRTDGAGRAPSAQYLLAYHPSARTLDLLYVQPGRDLDDARLPEPLPGIDAVLPRGEPSDPRAVKDWLVAWPRDGRFLPMALRAARELRPAGWSLYDLALLALEAYRLAPSRVRLSWLPRAEDVPAFMNGLLGAPEARPPLPSRIEVLNASGEGGIALRATKVIRLTGLDVIEFGNAPSVEARTYVLDRAGRPEEARRASEALACGELEVVTKLDLHATAPAALVLGSDYRRCGGLAKGD